MLWQVCQSITRASPNDRLGHVATYRAVAESPHLALTAAYSLRPWFSLFITGPTHEIRSLNLCGLKRQV